MNPLNPRIHCVVACWSLTHGGELAVCACCGVGINRHVRVVKLAPGVKITLGKGCANRLTGGGSYLTDDAVALLRSRGAL